MNLAAIHIPLAPFDSPDSWNCCARGECDTPGQHEPCQRKAGSKDDRISRDKTYFAKIHDHWYFGRFSEQWYGWSFRNWGTSGIQLDLIQDLYEIDITPLDEGN